MGEDRPKERSREVPDRYRVREWPLRNGLGVQALCSKSQNDHPTQVHGRGEDPHRAGRVPPGRPPSTICAGGRGSDPLLLLMDQGVHGGKQGEAGPGHGAGRRPDRIASPEDVTEILALISNPNQDQFHLLARFRCRFIRRGVEQSLGHDAAPFLHPALQRSQLSIFEPARIGLAYFCQQILGVCVWVFLKPQKHVAPHAFEGIFPGTPVASRAHLVPVGGPGFPLLPQVGQRGQEPVNALTKRNPPWG